MDGEKKRAPQELPRLEIDPSETYYPRPLWQRIGAFILIGLVVAATVACAFWKYIV